MEETWKKSYHGFVDLEWPQAVHGNGGREPVSVFCKDEETAETIARWLNEGKITFDYCTDQ